VIEVGEDAGGTVVRYGTTRAVEGAPVGELPPLLPGLVRGTDGRWHPRRRPVHRRHTEPSVDGATDQRTGDYLLAGSFSGS
jgi:hypothetical protein